MGTEVSSVLQTATPYCRSQPQPSPCHRRQVLDRDSMPHERWHGACIGLPSIVTDPDLSGLLFRPPADPATAPMRIDRPWRGVLLWVRRSSRCPSRENREGGANPPRWRHCKRETEPQPTVGTPVGRAWLNPPASQETCLDDQVTTLRSREVTRRPGTRPVLRVMPPAE